MKTFSNKTAVITGGASGIGKGIATKCLAEGMQVVLADIEEEALAQTADEFRQAGSNSVLPVVTDVAMEEALKNLLDKTLSEFGEVHLLFNNAGIGAGGGILDSSMNDWQWTMNVNLWSVIHGCRIFLPVMINQDTECHIVNTASAAGLMPYNPSIAYNVTKYGVVALSESMHLDMKAQQTRVGVSVLCPGFIRTNIMDAARNRPDHLTDLDSITGQAVAPPEALDAMRENVENGMPTSELADIVFDGIRNERLYILTHELDELLNLRTKAIIEGGSLEPITSFDQFE